MESSILAYPDLAKVLELFCPRYRVEVRWLLYITARLLRQPKRTTALLGRSS